MAFITAFKMKTNAASRPAHLAIVPKAVGLVVFDGMRMLDFAAPAEVLGATGIPTGFGDYRGYHLVTVGLSTEACRADSGVIVVPQVAVDSAPEFDTLIVPGGDGLERPAIRNRLCKWLSYRAPSTRRIATLSNGIYVLAMTGLLDNREAATHWRYSIDLSRRFPKLRVNPKALFVRDGPFVTAAGGSAGIDFALALVEEDYGQKAALGLARELIVFVKRPGNLDQYSESLRYQTQATDRFGDIAAWILCNLGEDLSVEALARRVCLCPRHFRRLFKETFGKTPYKFVNEARLEEAERRLAIPRNSIENIATSLRFQSIRSFRRAFEREKGITPRRYRVSALGRRTKAAN